MIEQLLHWWDLYLNLDPFVFFIGWLLTVCITQCGIIYVSMIEDFFRWLFVIRSGSWVQHTVSVSKCVVGMSTLWVVPRIAYYELQLVVEALLIIITLLSIRFGMFLYRNRCQIV